MKQETYDKWKSIIDSYDHSKETVKDYCLNNHINPKSYVRQDTPSDFMPAVVLPSAKQSSLSFKINGVSLHVDSSIEDSDLKRIIDICSRL